MPRPPIESSARSATIHVRVTAAMAAGIEAARGEMSRSDFVRTAVYNELHRRNP